MPMLATWPALVRIETSESEVLDCGLRPAILLMSFLNVALVNQSNRHATLMLVGGFGASLADLMNCGAPADRSDCCWQHGMRFTLPGP